MNSGLKMTCLDFQRYLKLWFRQKKPIVGHNMLMDLMLIHDKLYRPLPPTYAQFKQSIHMLFPVIYDTKHMSTNLRKPLQDLGYLDITNLGELHKQLSSEQGRSRYLFSPDIGLQEGAERYSNSTLHEAGYDSYICGSVFIRIAHIVLSRDIPSEKSRPYSFAEYTKAVSKFVNSVNLIRGAINHINIGSEDPESCRPQRLFVRSRSRKQPLNSSQLAQRFSSFGSVDICLQGKYQALVAVGNHKCARDILKSCYKDPDILATKYNPWKHSGIINTALWAGLLITGGLCAWSLLSGIKVNASASSIT